VLDPAPDACAGAAARLIQGAYDDPDGLATLARDCEAVTFDFENVPADAAHWLAERLPVAPPPQALACAQDRLGEKTLFRELGIDTPAFASVDSLDGLRTAVAQVGLPAILKTRRLGYDGKGQYRLHDEADIVPAWEALGGVPLILESLVPFQREVSLLAARGRDDAVAFYPLVENHHREGILRLSLAPCEAPALEASAREAVGALLRRLDYVGVLAVEFFVHRDRLLANEMAPRVHNSGHWTIEGAETSQFENHLRAVAGLPLGDTGVRGHSAMVNCIGAFPELSRSLALGAHAHDYGKSPRSGRKVGHLTLRTDDRQALETRLPPLLALVAETGG
jgi:5-(carboxyamino)imidazole ribonucleotide synthase